ncbi:hypothetical protein [Modestobacter sp. Leaf380]|uniref:hypothetical protein n=1 Tax=Modestobacter sp. Leaf380 TaxID=1736356 RepID=UPI0006F2B57C|nr:hypothetical protein [Modestobacter sp. Leaf380]KQS64341.1 hypothetical protein ASG41_17040 [Modestobacter sp. Leaf380]
MTRRPVLPGASELFFRRTDAPSVGPAPAPVSELPSLAAAASSPALRGNASRRPEDDDAPVVTDDVAPGATPLQLVRDTPDELSSVRSALPAAGPAVRARRSARERTKHEEKITVYCSAEELLAIESARLVLRGQHGVVADRGRIVREAVAVLLADLESHGEDSVLVRRLRQG